MMIGDLLNNQDYDDHAIKWARATDIMLEAMTKAIEEEGINPECVQSVMIMLLSESLKQQHGEKWRIELLNHMEVQQIDPEEEANARN